MRDFSVEYDRPIERGSRLTTSESNFGEPELVSCKLRQPHASGALGARYFLKESQSAPGHAPRIGRRRISRHVTAHLETNQPFCDFTAERFVS